MLNLSESSLHFCTWLVKLSSCKKKEKKKHVKELKLVGKMIFEEINQDFGDTIIRCHCKEYRKKLSKLRKLFIFSQVKITNSEQKDHLQTVSTLPNPVLKLPLETNLVKPTCMLSFSLRKMAKCRLNLAQAFSQRCNFLAVFRECLSVTFSDRV